MILRRITAVFVCIMVFMGGGFCVRADNEEKEFTESYLLMEVSTKTVIRAYNERVRVKMGSFNKLMTVLLAAEAVARGELSLDEELAASEYANSMQGAQIWLMPGEKMTLYDLLCAVIIGNANDAACVIAERIGKTEEGFTAMMNKRAAELGMCDTSFLNPNGFYDDDLQYTTAYDAALLLAELSKQEMLRDIFTTRLLEIKKGEVMLVTTNKPAYSFNGSIGFKCGSGPASGYFAAEGAMRNGVCYVAAAMDFTEEADALSAACGLLDAGFSGYTVVSPEIPDELSGTLAVKRGCAEGVRLSVRDIGNAVVKRGFEEDIKIRIMLPSYVYAPVKKGDKIGELRLYLGEDMISHADICAAEDVGERKYINVLFDLLKFLVTF